MDFKYYISNRADGNVSFYAGSGEVLSNRNKILTKLGFKLDDLVIMNQCHSADFLLAGIEHKGKGAFLGDDTIAHVDALITQEAGIILMAQGADCPLVAIFNEKTKVVAVIHSGWKGTQKEIIPKVLSYMSEEMGCDHKFTRAVVAPFAKGCCYEVGEEFLDMFQEYHKAFIRKEGKLFLDLEVVIVFQLSLFGIATDRIFFEKGCTMCSDDYYSFRKENKNAGRFSLMVWMDGCEY